MDVHYELNGIAFVWDVKKALANPGRHDGVTFEQAATVFFDPFFRLLEAGHATPSSVSMRLVACCSSCMSRWMVTASALFLPVGQRKRKGKVMSIPERIKTRLAKERPTTSITLRIPVDMVDSMKEIAPQRGFSGYQALLKSYIGEGLRRDEAQFAFGPTARLIEALKKRGVPAALLDEAARELATINA